MPKFNITLKNIDPKEICKKYGIITNQNIPINSTIISDLTLRIGNNNNYSFLDPIKKEHNCVFTFLDEITNQKLPKITNICCFWCMHNFEKRPIGCPIKYLPSRLTKQYYSEITKGDYTIRGSITKNTEKILKKENKLSSKFYLEGNSHYITDGIFCSFNCCLAFIKDNWHNIIYNNSEYYLNKIHYQFFKKFHKIIPAPSWRLLTKFGGHLDIEKFRNSFDNIEYIETDDYLSEIPKLKPIGFIFEKKIKF